MLLENENFPAGSEVLMTCVNIPSMAQILRYHSCIPVPLNLEFDSLCPVPLESYSRLITPKTKMILISYIYGCQFDVTELVQWAHSHGLLVVEDLAESFRGTKFSGHP